MFPPLNFAPFIAARPYLSDALDMNGGIRVKLLGSGDALRLGIGHGTWPVGVGFRYVVPAIRSLFDEEFLVAHSFSNKHFNTLLV